MPQNADHIAVNDLLGRPPGWLLHSGITLVFCVVVGALILSAFIKYPDELSGASVIQYEQTSINISSAVTAVLDTVLVPDGEIVQASELIGILQSDADWKELLDLDTLLDEISKKTPFKYLPSFQHLGAIQANYARWSVAASTYHQYVNNSGLVEQRKAIDREIKYTRQLIKIATDQLLLLDQQIELETSDYNRHKTLLEEGVISLQKYEEKKKTWLAILQQRENLEADLVRYELTINQLQQQNEKLTRTNKDEVFAKTQSFNQLTEELKGQLQAWKERFLIVAPTSGELIYLGNIVEKQLINSGVPLFAIQPSAAEETQLLAKLEIPAQGLGKITIGEPIIIRLDAYPYNEFGVLNTSVKKIAALPSTDEEGTTFYQVIGLLDRPLITSYGKQLPNDIIMSGTGTVITKDRSVLDRVFEQLLDIIKQD